MSEKIVLSFLGTGNYQSIVYQHGDQTCETKFAPEAVLAFYPDHGLYVCLTKEAKERHGADLREVAEYREVPIPSGGSESELWEMFEKIVEQIPDDAELIIDITHGFRSQPLLALAACLYLRTAKNVTVERIFYGAYEARDKSTNVAPIFDLTPFLELIDWSVATRQFLEDGNATKLQDILANIHKQTHIDKAASHKAEGLANLGAVLRQFGEALSVVRPKEALKEANRIPKAIASSKGDVDNLPQAKPLQLLLDQIERRSAPFAAADGDLFSPAGFRAQAEMIRLHLKAKQYQQAITLAREALVSKILKDEHFSERKDAEEKLGEWAGRLRNSDTATAEELDERKKSLALLWNKIADIRNDINHAGMRDNALSATKAFKNIEEYSKEVAALLES